MEFEVKEYMKINLNDFLKNNTKMINYSGYFINNEININDISKESNIYSYLNIILKENKLDKDNYNIYFKKNDEWYNKFIFYKKKDN